jgi:hypothetical protein
LDEHALMHIDGCRTCETNMTISFAILRSRLVDAHEEEPKDES